MCFPVFVCLCHVPSCCCPCGLLLLPVSPPLTCSQSSPGLFVGLVSPVSCSFPLFSPPVSHCLDCSHLSLVICCVCVCVYSPCILVSRCVLVIVCYVVCFVFFLVFPVISDFSLLFNLLVFSTHCLYDDFSIAYAYLDLLACSWTAYLCTESCLVKR